MPSSDPAKRLQDILDNIARIRAHLGRMTAKRFFADAKTQDAVERCLERISEAARKIGDVLDRRYPEVEFPKLRQFGSLLRHNYDGVDDDLIWQAVKERLDPLEAACRQELGAKPSKSGAATKSAGRAARRKRS
jgi:uncharacterized protein with HEPN domain